MNIIPWNSSIHLSANKDWIVETPYHFLRFTYSGNNEILQVTFDYLDSEGATAEVPAPYGQKFAEDSGWSILGVVSKRHIWFREEELHDVFDYLRDSSFFSKFSRCIFSGVSKGGYGALAFSAAAPGAVVVAIEPQSTLDSKIVPWETRYPIGDWHGRYIDGAECCKTASVVYVFYDKFFEPDRKHAQRILGHNVKYITCNHLRHGLSLCFFKMGILKEIMRALIMNEFSPREFRQLFRKNRLKTQRYARNLFDAALERGHYRLALKVCNALKDGDDRKYFVTRKALLTAALNGNSVLTTANSWLKKIGV